MFAITLTLLVCQHLSVTWSTRVPLEVYELPPAAATTNAAAAATSHDLHYLQQQQQHKNLAYATINNKQQQHNATTADLTTTIESLNNAAAAITSTTSTTTTHQLDRRRSRQMLNSIEKQQQEQHQQQQHQQQQHRFAHAAMQQQHRLHHSHQLQQQQHSKSAKDVRVLYQVGESEDDLPICAPNAVCSKIDLYETPWIERQCRCPDVNRAPNIILHHHNTNKDTTHPESAATAAASAKGYTTHNDKFHAYYAHQEKLLQQQQQHKRLLLSGDYADKRFDSLHLRKLMHKLGAVYQDDLDLQPSDFLTTNEDGGGGSDDSSLYDEDDVSDNEFPHRMPYKPQPQQQLPAVIVPLTVLATNGAHMRHSGHMGGNRAKQQQQLSYIGGCPSGLGIEDGHTIADKTRHYKMCSPVHKLPVCKHFRDYTWTLTTAAEQNVTEQIVHCRCPKNSVTYLTKRQPVTDGAGGFQYLFACSPLTRIRCQRKQPCKLFTVRKRQEFIDEVNINALCQCPKGHRCPSHHTQSGVLSGESFLEDNIQTYSGYCMVND